MRNAPRQVVLIYIYIFLVCFLIYQMSVNTLLVLLSPSSWCNESEYDRVYALPALDSISKFRIIKELPHVDCGDGGATTAPAATEAIPREWIPRKSKDSNDSSSAYDGDEESLLD